MLSQMVSTRTRTYALTRAQAMDSREESRVSGAVVNDDRSVGQHVGVVNEEAEQTRAGPQGKGMVGAATRLAGAMAGLVLGGTRERERDGGRRRGCC